ncbi:MAG: Phosphotransferase RcsD [Sodalis sp.]|uniref:hypothetical protein n=1 Tax=Sodalis sp. (in: enterobacteria) TaxID=1898979 RepID=UPI003872CEFB|nr:MAG: Phosphotransferase RcsD [Sodalis sp.]
MLIATALLSSFLVFILLFISSLCLLGYQVFCTYMVEKQHSLSIIVASMQNASTNIASRPISFMTLPANDPQALRPNDEIRLRPGIHFVNKPHKKTDAMIFVTISTGP